MADVQSPPPASPDAFSAKMYDHDNGQWVDVPANDVGAKVASGKFTFQQGIQIPVVSPQGQRGFVDSDKAYDEFTKNGMQWVTPQVTQAADQQQEKNVDSRNFGNQPLTAAALGVARVGTLGASDVALDAGGLSHAAKAVGDQNQLATGAGEVAGMLLPDSLAAGAAKGLGGLAEGAVLKGAKALGETGAVATKILPTIAREAAVGATFGAGSGVSEQALGHPDDVVDNMMAHIGFGAMAGGSLGALFGTAEVARPAMEKLVEKAAQGGRSVADKLASASAGKGIVAALTKAGDEAGAAKFGQAWADPEFRALATTAGPEAAEKALAEHAEAVKTVQGMTKNLTADIKTELKGASDGVQQQTAEHIKQAGGDIVQAAEDAYKMHQAAAQNFDLLTQAIKEPLTYDAAPLIHRFEGAVDQLNEGSAYARNVAKKIEGQLSAANFDSGSSEAGFFLNVRNQLNNISHDGLSAAESSTVKRLVQEADESLLTHTNPAISKSYEALKASEDVANTLRNVSDRTALRGVDKPLPGEPLAQAGHTGASRVIDEKKMVRTLSDPKTREVVQATIQNLETLSPEIKGLASVKTIDEKIAFQNSLELKLSKILPNSHIDGQQVSDVLEMLGNPKALADKLAKVQELQGALAQDASPLQRIMAAKQALGEPISKDLQTLAKHESVFDLLNKYKEAKTTGFDPIQAAKGMSVAGPKGALWGLRQSTVSKQLEVLAAIQKASQRGAELTEKAIKTTVTALTSAPAKKIAQGAAYVANSPSINDARKNYQKVKDQIQAYRPQQSSVAEHAPKIAQAIQARQGDVVKFLQSKLPADPFEENSISFNKTGYVPSDHDLSSFYRYVQAANNPMQVLDDISKNRVSPEGIETLKTVYPQIYQKLQTSVLDGIITTKADLTYQQKIELGTVFDIPTDYTLRPDFIARMQDGLNKDEGGRPSGPTSQRTVKIDLKPEQSVATQAQRSTYDLNH
jgi:hypothetical protein